MFRSKLAVWLLIALVAAWLASCSADVDGYHLATAESPATGSGAGDGGPTGGTSGSGGRALSGSGGAGRNSGGSSGTGGAQQPPREGGIDFDAGDSAPLSVGGSPAGGSGGGTGGGVTGGVAQNGGAGGTGGIPNTGGAVTGGAPNTGGATGGAPTGGAPTGGRPNTGGAPTGGAPTGGAPTGGAPTGGAPTGGAPTGGAPTGGAPTGGTAGTGGTGGYPGDPTHVPFTGASVMGITAASWVPSARKFYLLRPSTRQYFVLTTDGSVATGVGLQGSGTVANLAFGASATDVFFVSGSPATLFRQPIAGGTATQVQLPGSPALGTLSGAYAGGWFLIGNASGAFQALQDGSSVLTTSANLSQIHMVTTDTTRFAFRNQGPSLTATLHDIVPGTFSPNSTPCNTGTFNSSIDLPNGVYGSTVAWVFSRPFQAPLELNVGTVDATGTCTSALEAQFGTNIGSSAGSQVVGAIDSIDFLVNPNKAGSTATIQIVRAGDSTFSRVPVDVSMGTSITPVTFVVGVEATTHFAVLVTNDVPALISF